MRNVIIVIIFVIIGSSGFSQKIEFFKEDLTFKIESGTFIVDGLYYFRNTTNEEVKQLLFYPFPDVEKYGEISFIHITKAGDTLSQVVTKTPKGSLFKILIPAHREIVYHICYGQKLKSNQAKYIITTTQKWGKPFEEASYKLEIPPSIIITDFSIQPDTTFQNDNLRIYTWKRKDFMPDTDFEFEFKNIND